MSEKPLNHQVLIVRIPEPRVHTNADSLELFDILGYQIVAKKEQFKPGDLAVYVQPDSVVPQTEPFKWIWEAYVGTDGVAPAKRRRITVKKLRKEYSEGLLLPVSDFGIVLPALMTEGMEVSDVLGIKHYEPEETGTFGRTASGPKQKRYPKTVFGWMRFIYYNTLRIVSFGKLYHRESSINVSFESPEYDVVAQKAARSGFANSEYVVVTEKLHGSNGRFLFLDGVFYIGSHYQWKAADAPCIFTRVAQQHPWIEEWCRANEGRILYGEVLGDQKGYTYGFEKAAGELGFRAFDIWEPAGFWTKPWTDVVKVDKVSSIHTLAESQIVPILYQGPADMDKIKALTDGLSVLDGKTQREGVVISEQNPAPAGMRRPRQVKRVSNVFLEKDAK